MLFDLSSLAFPLWGLLVLYGIFLAGFALYSIFNLYHLLRFGTADLGLYIITGTFIIGTVLLVVGSFWLLAGYDWSASLSLSGLFHAGNTSPYFRF